MLALIETAGKAVELLTDTEIELELTLAWVTQERLEVSTQFTTSPFVKLPVKKAPAVLACCTLLIYHLYCGVKPPLLTELVKYTVVPAQMEVALALIEIAGVSEEAPVKVLLPIGLLSIAV